MDEISQIETSSNVFTYLHGAPITYNAVSYPSIPMPSPSDLDNTVPGFYTEQAY